MDNTKSYPYAGFGRTKDRRKKKRGILEKAKMYTSWKKQNLPGEIFKQEAISQSKVMALWLSSHVEVVQDSFTKKSLLKA